MSLVVPPCVLRTLFQFVLADPCVIDTLLHLFFDLAEVRLLGPSTSRGLGKADLAF